MNQSHSQVVEPSQRASTVRYGVLAALCTGASIAYLSRNCLGVAVADGAILEDLNCTREQLGWVMGPAFFSVYAAFQVPAGLLGHSWGSRRVLPLFAGVWAIFTGLMGLAAGITSVFLIYMSIGAAQAGVFPNSADTIKKWFPASRIAFVCGALGAFMSVGAAIALAISGFLLERMTWRFVFALFTVPGLAWAVWFAVWFRNRPHEHSQVNSAELDLIRGHDAAESSEHDDTARREAVEWSVMLTSRAVWCVSAQQFFRAAGYIFYSTWFPTYLKETRGVSTEQSGYLSSLPLAAVIVGSLSGGAVVDWIQARTSSRRLSRQAVAVTSMSLCALLIGLAYLTHSTLGAVLLISAGSLCAAFGGPCAYAVTIDLAGRRVPVVFSVMNMSGNIGAALCPLLVVWFVEATGHWDTVLFFFVGIYIAAAAAWLTLNPDATLPDSTHKH